MPGLLSPVTIAKPLTGFAMVRAGRFKVTSATPGCCFGLGRQGGHQMASFGLWAFSTFWNAFGAVIFTAVHVGLAVLVTLHVLLHKRDVPAAIGWMGLARLSPIIGPGLYWAFGINRVRRRAYRISRRYAARRPPPP